MFCASRKADAISSSRIASGLHAPGRLGRAARCRQEPDQMRCLPSDLGLGLQRGDALAHVAAPFASPASSAATPGRALVASSARPPGAPAVSCRPAAAPGAGQQPVERVEQLYVARCAGVDGAAQRDRVQQLAQQGLVIGLRASCEIANVEVDACCKESRAREARSARPRRPARRPGRRPPTTGRAAREAGARPVHRIQRLRASPPGRSAAAQPGEHAALPARAMRLQEGGELRASAAAAGSDATGAAA